MTKEITIKTEEDKETEKYWRKEDMDRKKRELK
jgi:hypothetical protein